MPSELQRVAEQLLACLNEAPRAVGYLHDMARKCREAAAWIGSQSNNPSARTAAMHLDDAARRCEESTHSLALAEARAKEWVEQMVSGIRTAKPAGGSTGQRRLDAGGDKLPREPQRQDDRDDKQEADKTTVAGDETIPEELSPGRRISDEEGYRLQQKLPRREESELTQPKTRGLWVDKDGSEELLVSGQHDEWFQKAADFLRDLGIPPRNGDSITTPSHVETKFAMRMRVRGLKHETIMVNKLPCPGKWGCRALIGLILPPGSTLTVFGPDGFKKTYPQPPAEREQS
ncbi:nucleic acid/nucleotide deaminase of polymorphic system toxin [Kribbella amoyensis]|uniref:Nucleic acid/nucleotide deaminase of polymorphic system toxin n=1 Tax=Kribbella amoyensis TaxID=996641 RepID=A0A561BJN9_9ACTN|nr:DddA-like double-stranded DNA deaminase toxin [Kribbella amoyensis]TWD79077.1 nucleic acid/nucleotide deaminase of polymorphic system toxin [Kribbella amoyensis]